MSAETPNGSSTLPSAARDSAAHTLNNLMAESDVPSPSDATPTQDEGSDLEDGQVLEVEGDGFNGNRTVFEDSKSFTVKHPLFHSWTLWYDSPNTKGLNLATPATPSATTPQTPAASGGHSSAQSWMDDIKQVITFDSVEEFWGLYHSIMPPSKLPVKGNYYLFKEGIIPAWEDPANKLGGAWSYQMPKDKSMDNIDQWWLQTMLTAIGETFDPSLTNPAPLEGGQPAARPIVTGVVCAKRSNFFRLSIWTRLAMPSELGDVTTGYPDESGDELANRVYSIGNQFKTDILGYGLRDRLGGGLASEVEFQSHKDKEKKAKQGKKYTAGENIAK